MGYNKSRSSIFSSTVNEESFDWEELTFAGQYHHAYTVIERQNGEKYLIYNSPPLYGLMSYPNGHDWQTFKAYRLTEKQFKKSKDEIDKKLEKTVEYIPNQKKVRKRLKNLTKEERQEVEDNLPEELYEYRAKDDNYAMWMVISGKILPIIFTAIISPIVFFFQPLGWMFPIMIFLFARFLYDVIMKYVIEKKIDCKLEACEFEMIHFKVEHSIFMKITNYMITPVLIMMTIFFYFEIGLNTSNSWTLVLGPIALPIFVDLYTMPELGLKAYIKLKGKAENN